MAEVKKLSIYLPENRILEVDKYRSEMNFSAMFWSAFDQEKLRLDAVPKGKKMSEVVNRLRKSKLEHEETQRAEGHTAGAEWASDTAKFHELALLREFVEDRIGRGLDISADDVATLLPDPGCEFWDKAIGETDSPPTDAFVGGFVRSAIDVLNEAEIEGL